MPSEQSRADQLLAHIFDAKTRGVKEPRLRYRRTADGRSLADHRQQRRTPTPVGTCEHCWCERQSDNRPGRCYSVGYPMLDPKLVTLCPDCVGYSRTLNVELTPFSL
jgi:hypothetical protein